MIGIEKLFIHRGLFFHCNGTPSQEEHKTCFGILTTTESALTIKSVSYGKSRLHIANFVIFFGNIYQRLQLKKCYADMINDN
jgi:hypothetical protein